MRLNMKWILVSGGAVMALAFQNCSESRFESTADDLGASVASQSVSGGTDTTMTQVSTSSLTVVANNDKKEKEPENKEVKGSESGEEEDHEHETSSCKEKHESEVKSESDDDRMYVCVLDGPGKSFKAAIEHDDVVSKRATPDDICMSKKACKEIISQVLDVKGPEYRGFCPEKNPHVVAMTDVEVQELVDSYKEGSK